VIDYLVAKPSLFLNKRKMVSLVRAKDVQPRVKNEASSSDAVELNKPRTDLTAHSSIPKKDTAQSRENEEADPNLVSFKEQSL
jgi:hypothetical protein